MSHRVKPVNALLVSVSYGLPYENVEILSHDQEMALGIHNWFEDEQVSFRCKDGLIVIPESKLILVHLNRNTVVPPGSTCTTRITLEYELTYGNSYVIDQNRFGELGIPQIYTNGKQFVFINNEGTHIALDSNVVQVHLSTNDKIKTANTTIRL